MAVDLTGQEVPDDAPATNGDPARDYEPATEMHTFDRLPAWLRPMLRDSAFSFKATDIAPYLFSGQLHAGNARSLIAQNERLKRDYFRQQDSQNGLA